MASEARTCTGCGQSYPATAEYYYPRKEAGRLRSRCKVCENAYNRARRAKNPDSEREALRRYYETHKTERRASAKAWRDGHPDTANKHTQEWRARNKERITAYNRRYAQERRALARKPSAAEIYAPKTPLQLVDDYRTTLKRLFVKRKS